VVARPTPHVQLADRETFDRFSVDADVGLSSAEIAEALHRNDAGSLASDDTAWVSVDWIRRSAGADVDERWGTAFDAMVDYAAERNWYSPESRSIQAHIERSQLSDERIRPQPVGGGLSADHFIAAFREHPAGVAVVTADIGTGPVGLTATSVSSLSADPAMLGFSVSESSSSAPVIKSATTVVVHLLGSREIAIARLCSTSGIDRFADTSLWDRLPTGEPYFTGVQSWIRGEIVSAVPAGTSTLLVVHALEASPVIGSGDRTDDPPLVYHKRTWHALGEHSSLRD
jgi:flavin reductase (DIM6/NTAB) family NADH-FMN oxidoreductase RutF